jgi:hypothetical protein
LREGATGFRMKNELDIVRDVSIRLDGAGIAYMLTGSMAMTDTPPEIAAMVRDRMMALSGSERFVMGVRMFDAARRMVLASLPAGLPEPEGKRLLFERIYGEPLPPELMS